MAQTDTHENTPEHPPTVAGGRASGLGRGIRVTRLLIHDVAVAAEAGIIVASAVVTKILYLDAVLDAGKASLNYAGLGCIMAVIAFGSFRQFGLHRLDRLFARSLGIARIFLALGMSFLLFVALLYMLKSAEEISRLWMALWFASSFALIVAERAGVRGYAGRLTRNGRLKRRVAIYGDAPLANRIYERLQEHPEDNVSIVGLFPEGGRAGRDAPTGDIDNGLRELIRLGMNNRIDQILLALPSHEDAEIRDALARLAVLPVEVHHCPRSQLAPYKILGCSQLGSLQLYEVQRPPMTDRDVRVKSTIDIALASTALVLLSPLFPLVALAIKLDSPGSVFFRQRRHGFNHQIIRVFKFRTMSVREDGDRVTQASENDPRVTRVGRMLRRSSLDELPQLINVIRGEMSLVGPRPHALVHNEYYGQIVQRYANRHRVKPGITGWAQVHGFRGETADPEMMRERVRYDLEYIDNWSVGLDLQILARTVLMTLSGALFNENPRKPKHTAVPGTAEEKG